MRRRVQSEAAAHLASPTLLEDVEEQLRRAGEANDALQQQLLASQAAARGASADAQAQHALKSEIMGLQVGRQAAAEAAAALDAQLQELRAESQASAAAAAELRAQLEREAAEKAASQGEAASLAAQLQALSADRTAATASLEARLEAAQTDKDASEARAAELAAQLQQARTEMAVAARDAASAEAVAAEADARAAEAEAKLSEQRGGPPALEGAPAGGDDGAGVDAPAGVAPSGESVVDLMRSALVRVSDAAGERGASRALAESQVRGICAARRGMGAGGGKGWGDKGHTPCRALSGDALAPQSAR